MREFLQTHAALIQRLARGAVPGRRGLDPQDVAQEVVLTLLRSHRAGAFDPARVENPEGYLRVVVANATRRAHSRKRGDAVAEDAELAEMAEEAAKRGPDSTPSIEELTQRALDARRRIEELKAMLRPRDAVAFALLVEDGLSIEEAAATLGTTANNVYQMRHRILTAARELEPGSVRAGRPDGSTLERNGGRREL
jgi:RNA polymerase sigma factor (sigma-70 family)